MKRNQFDPIAQYRENVQNVRKYNLFSTIIKSIKNTDILARFVRFLGTEQSDQIDSFHEQPVSEDTRLEYQQQGNRSNLKFHFFRLRGVWGGSRKKKLEEKKYVLGILKL